MRTDRKSADHDESNVSRVECFKECARIQRRCGHLFRPLQASGRKFAQLFAENHRLFNSLAHRRALIFGTIRCDGCGLESPRPGGRLFGVANLSP